MAIPIDEATTSYRAIVKLMQLYNAYRVTSRANGMVLERMNSNLAGLENLDDVEKEIIRAELVNRLALSRESGVVWTRNFENLKVRLSELVELTP